METFPVFSSFAYSSPFPPLVFDIPKATGLRFLNQEVSLTERGMETCRGQVTVLVTEGQCCGWLAQALLPSKPQVLSKCIGILKELKGRAGMPLDPGG